MKEIKELIWQKLDRDRKFGRLHKTNFPNIKFLEQVGHLKGIDFLKDLLEDDELFQQALSQNMSIPEYLIDFLDLFLNQSMEIFDPWTTRESYLIRRNAKGLGYTFNVVEAQLIKHVFSSFNFELKEGDALLSSQDLSTFDVVVSFPPFGMRTATVEAAGTGEYSADLLIKCCNEINSGKEVIFLSSGRISFDRKIKHGFDQHGIGVKALFHLPEGSHLPLTSISSYLTIAEKGYRGQTFVAELSEDRVTNETIFNNYKSSKPGKSIALGSFVDFSSFKSFESLSKSEEVIRKGRATGYSTVRLKDLIEQGGVSSIRNEEWALENHRSNCVYIPKIGNSKCVTHPSELQINLRNCFRVELQEKKIVPEYLVRFFNTPLGQLSLDSSKIGAAMKSLNSSSLFDALVFVPERLEQIKALSLDNKINSYINEFRELKDNLWSKPREQYIIQNQLRIFEDLDSVERWFDGIPFPLSSILWKYYATTNTKEKYEHLLHFFEALPEFISMLFLSSYFQNPDFYKAESEAWLKNDPQYREWYKRTDFGGWNNLFANLAKATRKLLNEDKKDITISLLGRPNSIFLNFITSKSVFNILDAVRQYRSDWKAHGGVSSNDENQSRLTILEEKLNELRKIVKDSFSTCRIVVPGMSSFENGVFKYKVKVLIGNRTPFNEIDVESTRPMDVSKLYMIHEGQNTPVELLPFIRYNQESKACYYYNKVESGNTRWVSFHYEETSELKEPLDDKFMEVLGLLRQDEE